MATSRPGKHRRPRRSRSHLPVAAGGATVAAAVVGALTISTAGASLGQTDITALQAPARPAAIAAPSTTADAFASLTSATSSLTTAIEQAAEVSHAQVRSAEKKAAKAKRAAAAERAAREADERAALASMYTKPLGSYQVATRYGVRGWAWSRGYHTGLDLTSGYGTPVKAVHSGKVTFSGWDGAYGYKVEITHPDGTETWYAHMSSLAVSGGKVTTGQVIGNVGSTGNSSGNHLHLEVHAPGGGELDPYAWLQERGVSL